ncbi:hypothetical protein [Limnohabitans sp. 2KL-3]|uniref:hypothetical protein n=1 Tax=Limnohabitans sp. 2KL-3 TaxID=1100700 RepID=UPI000A617967|nr:hypothetical protein [Limnohabitans sp. 2KL-3]
MSLYKKRPTPIRIALLVMTLSGLVLTAQAQGTSAAALSGSVSLKDVFETAWQRLGWITRLTSQNLIRNSMNSLS